MLADFDIFFFWRRVLMIACTIYAIVTIAQSAYAWYVRLKGPERYTSMARQYLLIQLLRVSPRRFVWQLVDLAVLAAVFLALVFLHVPAQ